MENEITIDNSNNDFYINDSDYVVDSSLFSDIHFLSKLNNLIVNNGFIILNDDVKIYNSELAYLFLYSDEIIVQNIDEHGAPKIINTSTYSEIYTEAFFEGFRKFNSDFSNLISTNPNNINFAFEKLKKENESNWSETKKFNYILNLKNVYYKGFYAGYLTKFIEFSQNHNSHISFNVIEKSNYSNNIDISHYFKLILEHSLYYDVAYSKLRAELSKNNLEINNALKHLQFYAGFLFMAFEYNKFKNVNIVALQNRSFPLFIDYLCDIIAEFSLEDIFSIVSFFENMSNNEKNNIYSKFENDPIKSQFYYIIDKLNHQKTSYSNIFSPWGYKKDLKEWRNELMLKIDNYVRNNQKSESNKYLNSLLFELKKMLSNDFDIDYALEMIGDLDFDDIFFNSETAFRSHAYYYSIHLVYFDLLKKDSIGNILKFRHSLFANIALKYLKEISFMLKQYLFTAEDKLNPDFLVNLIPFLPLSQLNESHNTISQNKHNYSNIINQPSLSETEKDTGDNSNENVSNEFLNPPEREDNINNDDNDSTNFDESVFENILIVNNKSKFFDILKNDGIQEILKDKNNKAEKCALAYILLKSTNPKFFFNQNNFAKFREVFSKYIGKDIGTYKRNNLLPHINVLEVKHKVLKDLNCSKKS